MEFHMAKREIYLRLSAILSLVLTACLVGFDTQTKVVLFSFEKKATYKDIVVLKILVYITSAAAGYNVLQLCKHCSLSTRSGGSFKGYYMYMVWITFLLDQIAVYLTFGANTAALEAALFAQTGSEAFQWMKVCNKFTRFCHLIAGALLSGFLASLLMALISAISAYNVFRMYSSKWFMRLKGK